MSPPSKRMKTTKRVTCIEGLPPEMISELFEHLPPKDLASCSLVNKRWHSIYVSFKLHSLVATDSEDFFRWYHSNRPIQEAERCDRGMFIGLIEKPLLSNLKHLVLAGSLEFDLNDLNRFQQLVHLEINFNYFDQKKVHLNLPRLNVLAFHHFNYDCDLSIDCPQLSTLLYTGEPEDVNLLKVKQPGAILKLETKMIGAKLVPFKGVECLVTGEYRMISKATLLFLPRLRELRYNQDIESVIAEESRDGDGTVDRVKKMLSEFLGEAKRLKGSDFRFRFTGLQLTNVREVNKIEAQVYKRTGKEYVHSEYVYMKNYHLIEPGALHFVRQVYYTRLLSHVTGEFPRCFSQKFTNIETVQVNGLVKDADHLLWFLKSQRFLRRLELVRSELNQEFYDQLPSSTPSLASLVLGNRHCEKGLQVNFDFIGRLSSFSELAIEPGIWLKSVRSLTRSLRRLKRDDFIVRSGCERFEIDKTGQFYRLN